MITFKWDQNTQKKIRVKQELYIQGPVFQKLRQDEDIPDRTKFKRVHYHLTCFTRIAKGSSLSRNKRMQEGGVKMAEE